MSICSVHLIQFYKSFQLIAVPGASSFFTTESSCGGRLVLLASYPFLKAWSALALANWASYSTLALPKRNSYLWGFLPIGLSRNDTVIL